MAPSVSSASGPSWEGWEGDEMLHVYLCDYLRKRGYTQAALALSAEAGLSQQQAPPIDAPQSLLFEWWVILSQLLAEKMDPTPSAHMQSSSAALEAVQFGGASEAGDAASTGQMATASQLQSQPTTAPLSAIQHGGHSQGGRIASAHIWPQQPPRSQPSVLAKSAEQSAATASTRGQHCNQSTQPQQPGAVQQRGPGSALSPQDLEASNRIGLARPASRVLIQQCMDMMNFGAKPIEALSAAEAQALAKRVTRLQTAQNEAQKRLAMLHGLQPSKPLPSVLSPAPQPSQALPPTQSMSVLEPSQLPYPGARAGQKRKESPNQIGTIPLLRRLSQPNRSGSPNTSSVPTPSMRATSTSQPPSPIGPATDNTFSSGVPLHSVFRRPSSSIETPPSLLPPDSAGSRCVSPQVAMVRPSGMPFTSPGAASVMSLGAEWPGSASASQSPVCGLQPHAQAWSSFGSPDLLYPTANVQGSATASWQPGAGNTLQAAVGMDGAMPLPVSPAYAHGPGWTSNAFAVGVGDKGGQMDAYAGLGNQAAFVGNPAARWNQADAPAYALGFGNQGGG
jgi:hypothetical protein